MKITIQYFAGCPHWEVADERVRTVLRDLSRADVELEYQLISSAREAERVGFRGSPTVLIDGRDPLATGDEPIGISCRVYRTEEGVQGAPTVNQLRALLARDRPT
ncbi:MAG TPA: thioredoxin family protein [Candidatus Dormibacteraeota bacterium]|nr:thioredoxin family protein [Candidatus Dormibacteraeota bacterium]